MTGILSKIESLFDDWRGRVNLILAAAPVLVDLLTAGPAAFASFRERAPDAAKHLQELADALKRNAEGNAAAPATERQVAAVGAHLVGVSPPGWSDAATERWWNRASDF